MASKKISNLLFSLGAVALLGYIIATVQQAHDYAGWLLMSFFLFIAIGFRFIPVLKGFFFTVMIFAAVSL
ncbi:MAG TPA: hypothetical protein VNQ55_05610, partial [Parapedobacter sp.]|nr:hypothetical protein [Parapedobacter sp.]